MRALLDECVPKRLRRELPDHDVMTVVEMGWSGIKNGELLALAAEQFECFLTVDTNVERLAAKGPAIRAALANIQPHQFVTISA